MPRRDGCAVRAVLGELTSRVTPKTLPFGALSRDWERMVAFYRFPKDHWIHLRTTNPVESPFVAVQLRTDATKLYKKVADAEVRIFKILRSRREN